MRRNPLPALALAFGTLLAAAPVFAAPFASYPAAPPPNGSALALVWQGGPSVVTAANPWMRANLGVAQVRSLESFAVALGVTLGSANDQPVFDAANTAIIAAKHTGGLAVALPVGLVEKAAHLLLDNNGGYYCPIPGQCTVQDVYAGPYAAKSWLVEKNDPYATNVVLAGINFYGGWSYGAGSYASNPESDPALDKRGGLNLTGAFSGVSDATYYANSNLNVQEPRDTIENIGVAGFAGTCVNTAGAGAITYHNVRIENCGGDGWDNAVYDSKWSDIDIGGVGRVGFLCSAAGCANDQFVGLKSWYAGQRRISGQTQALVIQGNTNTFIFNGQDMAGDCILDDEGFANTIFGDCEWQGAIPWMENQVSALTMAGNVTKEQIFLVAAMPPYPGYAAQLYPRVNLLVKQIASLRVPTDVTAANHNNLTITAQGWPNDQQTLNPAWISGVLDTSNALSLNGVQRIPRRWTEDPATGTAGWGLQLNGSLVGLVVNGASGAYPGQVTLLTQLNGQGQLQGFATTATAASGALTSTANYADGETVTIGGVTYTFRATLTGAANEVHVGSSEAASLASLTCAINASGCVQGTDYGWGTVYNLAAQAANNGAHVLTVTAVTAGIGGNGVATSTTAAHASWSAAALAGGGAGTQTYTDALTWDAAGGVYLPSVIAAGPYPNNAAACAAHLKNGQLWRDNSDTGGALHVASC